jgi:glucosamine--fructose-6-phosphate aminotransferase (isomerizing)
MTSASESGFERDILDQPAALAAYAAQPLPPGIAELDVSAFDRIIMTGMGSSDYLPLGLELLLARRGLPVWRIQTSHLLQAPEWITPRTLLWITSQSGKSGEVVALLDRVAPNRRGLVVAVTNDPESPLASAADHCILLHSGAEATVSSKSYLNSLGVFHRIAAVVEGRDDAAAANELRDLAALLRPATAAAPAIIDRLATKALAGPNPRFALVGSGEDATTALTGALIMKEASKVAAEGYLGGAFRHGPLELAGPGLTALLFGSEREDVTLSVLARDLAATGSTVISVGPLALEGAAHIAVPAGPAVSRLAHAMVVLQHLSVALARAGGYVPGAFRYGQKITAQV